MDYFSYKVALMKDRLCSGQAGLCCPGEMKGEGTEVPLSPLCLHLVECCDGVGPCLDFALDRIVGKR